MSEKKADCIKFAGDDMKQLIAANVNAKWLRCTAPDLSDGVFHRCQPRLVRPLAGKRLAFCKDKPAVKHNAELELA
jgi:hypothetical protein